MKHLNRLLPLSLAALLFAGIGGCQHDEPITGRADQYDQPWLTLGSVGLRSDTRIGEARRSRDAGGILHVGVPVRNVTGQQLYVEYHVTFLDAAGREINQVTGTLAIPANQTREAAGNSTSPQAERFHVELNYPRVN
jgi:hypothetical protein